MTFDQFRKLIAPLAVHFGAVRDEPTWKLYHRALMVDPAPSLQLLQGALARAANRRYFPTTAELRADAEAERQAILQRNAYEGCDVCRDESTGWVSVLVDGVTRLQRCDCWAAYQAGLARQGVGAQLELPEQRALPMPSDG